MSNNWTGRRHSEESKKKISDSKRSVPNSTEHNAAISTARKGMSNNWTGRKHSEESKKKISAGCKGKSNNWTGRKHSEETKTKMAAARLGKKFPRVK
jgi:hypothetical protein